MFLKCFTLKHLQNCCKTFLAGSNMAWRQTVVTCKIKHLQKCFKSRRLPAALKHFCKCFILHVPTSKNVLAAVKILQNILAVSCLLADIHEPALFQPITVFPWLAWEWRHAARRGDKNSDWLLVRPFPKTFLQMF